MPSVLQRALFQKHDPPTLVTRPIDAFPLRLTTFFRAAHGGLPHLDQAYPPILAVVEEGVLLPALAAIAMQTGARFGVVRRAAMFVEAVGGGGKPRVRRRKSVLPGRRRRRRNKLPATICDQNLV